MQRVDIKDFEQSNVKVERERYNIDILITNDDKKEAVGIENKIWAGDQPGQLQRYHDELKRQGYGNIRLLYLTLYGHPPSEDSAGGLDCISCISYKHDLPPWLKRCQHRAYDEPGLRESVGQYLQLIRKQTGTDYRGAYMTDLTKLCLEGDKLVLVHDLNEAMTNARVYLLRKLWDEIDSALRVEISGLPPKDEDGINKVYSVSEDRIKCFITPMGRNCYHGLYYSLFRRGIASLCVEAGNGDRLRFGVRCHKDHREHCQLKAKLTDVSNQFTDWWPGYQKDNVNLKNPTRENLQKLSNEADRKKHAKQIAQRLEPFWDAVKVADLA